MTSDSIVEAKRRARRAMGPHKRGAGAGRGAPRRDMIAGIVLAGGKSSRMGRPKALLPIGSSGDTFLDRVTHTLLDAGIHDVVVVVGADAAAIRAEARPRSGVRIVDNPDYDQGQL